MHEASKLQQHNQDTQEKYSHASLVSTSAWRTAVRHRHTLWRPSNMTGSKGTLFSFSTARNRKPDAMGVQRKLLLEYSVTHPQKIYSPNSPKNTRSTVSSFLHKKVITPRYKHVPHQQHGSIGQSTGVQLKRNVLTHAGTDVLLTRFRTSCTGPVEYRSQYREIGTVTSTRFWYSFFPSDFTQVFEKKSALKNLLTPNTSRLYPKIHPASPNSDHTMSPGKTLHNRNWQNVLRNGSLTLHKKNNRFSSCLLS